LQQVWSNIRIGIIGKGSQYQRISKILIKKKLEFFVYKPKNKKYFDKKKYETLQKCNVIFILSPNDTHLKYIKLLSKDRYIFCEKPPTTNLKQLNELERIITKKIYFNYNFRFSKIGKILNDINKYNLGRMIYGSIITGHGLSFKNDYKKSWRSQKKLCKKGIFEIVTIHWIDLLNYYFKLKKIKNVNMFNFSKIGNSYDNVICKLSFENNSEIDIFSSYSSPLIKKILLVFSNGTIEQNDNSIEIRGPALNLDREKFFKKPKLIRKYNIKNLEDYNLSLNKSVDYFLYHVKNKLEIPKKSIQNSLNSNKLIL